MWAEEKKEIDGITINEFNNLCIKAYSIKEEVDKYEDLKKEANERLTKIKKEMSAFLEENHMGSFKSEFGNVVIVHKSSAKIDSKEILFNHLKDIGEFENLATIHSNTLNAYFKQELANKEAAGDYNYELPGVTYKTYTDLTLKKIK